ncbi:MAG: hypothetical protein ACRC8Y_06535 [Chroococcales cyanobacterium]
MGSEIYPVAIALQLRNGLGMDATSNQALNKMRSPLGPWQIAPQEPIQVCCITPLSQAMLTLACLSVPLGR